MSDFEPSKIDYPQEKIDKLLSEISDPEVRDSTSFLIDLFLEGGGAVVKSVVMRNFLAEEKKLGSRKKLKAKFEKLKAHSNALLVFNKLKSHAHAESGITHIRTDAIDPKPEQKQRIIEELSKLIDALMLMYEYELAVHREIYNPKKPR